MGQLEKNTVKAENQLKENEFVRFYPGGEELKVLFVGNSITRHGVNKDIGWFWDFGMAASSEDKDYVHLMMQAISKKYKASYCVCQAYLWEMNYQKADEMMHYYTAARDFEADIIFMRLIENVPASNFDNAVFKTAYEKLLQYFNKRGNAQIILSDGFWKHPADGAIAEVAAEKGYAIAHLGDLGELDEMKAIGLFANEGVANHPGDKGMEQIAKRLLEKMR